MLSLDNRSGFEFSLLSILFFFQFPSFQILILSLCLTRARTVLISDCNKLVYTTDQCFGCRTNAKKQKKTIQYTEVQQQWYLLLSNLTVP